MIHLDQVVVTFNAGIVNEVRALRALSLTVQDGELVTVVGSNGALTGYHWGLTRKRAMLGWEAGRAA